MKKRIGIQGFLIFSSLAAILLFPKFFFSGRREGFLDGALGVLGLAMVLAGFLARAVSRGFKAEASSDGKTLISGGPYALVRNPMYAGTFLIGAGIILALLQWWVFILFACIYAAIYVPQVKKEEQVLVSRFGPEYREYCKETPRFFPGITRILTTPPRDYLRLKWEWIQKELPSFIAVVAVLSVIYYYVHGRASR
jgi:protein-S-isoprenylcysteine O-methyltransferase Ste14